MIQQSTENCFLFPLDTSENYKQKACKPQLHAANFFQ